MIGILDYVEIYGEWLETFKGFWNFINTPLSIAVQTEYSDGFLFAPLLDALGIGDITILSFMLGTGLAIYCGYQLTIWLLNLIT